MDEMESGAVALGMVLGYFQLYVPIEELRGACGVSREAPDAGKIAGAGRAYGMETEVLKGSLEDFAPLAPPFILETGKRHFVVVERIHKGRVRVNDPARGPVKQTLKDLSSLSAGRAISFKVGPDFKRGGQPPSIWRSLERRLQGTQGSLALILLASLALIVPELALPIFAKVFIDRVLVENSSHWLPLVLFGLLATGIVQACLTYLRALQLNKLTTSLGLSSTGKFFAHLLTLPMAFYTHRDVGDLGGRVTANNEVAQALSGQVALAMISGLSSVFLVLMMWRFDPELTVITVVLAGMNFLVLRHSHNAQTVKNQKLVGAKYAVYGQSYIGLKTIQSLKASAAEPNFFATWAGTLTRLSNAKQTLSFSTTLLGAMPATLATLSVISIMIFGGSRVMGGHLSVGDLVAFSSLATSFTAPVSRFVSFWQTLQSATAQMIRLDDVMQNHPDVEVAPRLNCPSRRLSGFLEVEDLTFGYDPHLPPLVQGLSFKLEPGQQVALVGATGCGKSTVAKLICGLYAPTSGRILFDGKSREEWSRSTLSCSLALVDQNIQLFAGTIAENLSLWDESIPRERIVSAAKDADIHDTIASRPGGYESLVSEDGINFSGGQKQRLEIARALAMMPSIMVLDEATSALDTKVEAQVVTNLRRRGCTCVVIAHRLSMVRDCDEIIVLDKGRVVQRGTHDELIGVEGRYRELVHSE
jgi:NHLM bacteriocin system ABC transporter peptidase/ATP-binding protein